MKARLRKCMWILFERWLCINEDVLVGESPLFQVVIDDEYQQRLDDLPTKVIVKEHINEDTTKLVPQLCQRPTRVWKLSRRLEDFVVVRKFANLVNFLEHPKDFAEAWAKDDAQNWRATVEKKWMLWKRTTHGCYQSCQKIAKPLVASGYFKPRGMFKVELYATKRDAWLKIN